MSMLLVTWGCAPRIVRYPGPLAAVGRDATALEEPAPEEPPRQLARRHAAEGAEMARAAAYFVDRHPLRHGGVTYRYDCSGLVEAASARAGQPLHGNTAGLWLQAEAAGLDHERKRPSAGDLVFFDDTHDRNGNGKLDDDLTHVAIVERVDDDGTMTLVHKGSQGVVRISMNLERPHDKTDASGKVLNSPLRVKSSRDPRGTVYLAGELWRGSASFWQADPSPLALLSLELR